jgi:hypothetical protein
VRGRGSVGGRAQGVREVVAAVIVQYNCNFKQNYIHAYIHTYCTYIHTYCTTYLYCIVLIKQAMKKSSASPISYISYPFAPPSQCTFD